MYLNSRIFSNDVMYINLTFIEPYIIIYFYSKSNKKHRCLNLFYFWKTLYVSQFILFLKKKLYMSQFILFLKKTLHVSIYFIFEKTLHVSIYFIFEKKKLYMSQFILFLKKKLYISQFILFWKKKHSTCLNLFYFWKKLYMSQFILFKKTLYMSQFILLKNTLHVSIYLFLKTLYISVWHMSFGVCKVMISWWWTERPSETCRVFFKNKIETLVRLVGFAIEIKYI